MCDVCVCVCVCRWGSDQGGAAVRGDRHVVGDVLCWEMAPLVEEDFELFEARALSLSLYIYIILTDNIKKGVFAAALFKPAVKRRLGPGFAFQSFARRPLDSMPGCARSLVSLSIYIIIYDPIFAFQSLARRPLDSMPGCARWRGALPWRGARLSVFRSLASRREAGLCSVTGPNTIKHCRPDPPP